MAFPLHKKINVFEGHQVPIIRYRGTFNWTELYRLVRHWLDSQSFDFDEKRYKHKGDEIEVEMRGERKIDSMHKWYVEVDFHIWDLKSIDLVEGSKTVQKNTGKVEITIKGSVELDYSKRFNGGKLNETLGLWWTMISKKDIEVKHFGPLTDLTFTLHDKLKKYLNITGDNR